MPCRCEGAEYSEARELRKKLDKVTRAACDMRTILRRAGLEKELTNETKQWIAMHDDWDRRRIAEEEARGEREQARQAGLAKLTLEERRALGL